MLKSDAHTWYISHSGFVVRTTNYLLIFDYYRDDFLGARLPELLQNEAQTRKVVFFASHGHSDHFNPSILKLTPKQAPYSYVLADDITEGRDRDDVLFVGAQAEYDYAGLHIETLTSTDVGVAFVVTCDGLVLFHAGDLNWWHWAGEPDEENASMAERYKSQIDILKGRSIDLAFIPLDPRLEAEYHWGLSYFMKQVGAKMVFPMHFWDDYSIFKKLERDLPLHHLAHVVQLSATCREATFTNPQ